jgi:hypothetical protein
MADQQGGLINEDTVGEILLVETRVRHATKQRGQPAGLPSFG